MIESQPNQRQLELLAMGLIGELKQSGACDIKMLNEVLSNLPAGNALSLTLRTAVNRSKLPDKIKQGGTSCQGGTLKRQETQ